MGENPGRPAYPCAISSCNSKVVLSTLSSKAQVLDTRTINQDRKACTKSNWVHISVTNHSTMTQTDLWSITKPWINVTRQQRAEMCQSQADRPRKHVENAEQLTTDSREESKPPREGRRRMAQSPKIAIVNFDQNFRSKHTLSASRDVRASIPSGSAQI